MIYIHGDTHRELFRFCGAHMPGESTWTDQDYLIITGDFGFVFTGEDQDEEERLMLDALARRPYTILFVDGNHEGFPFLSAYPQQVRFGAPVRKIRDNIFWLQRGYIYTIEGNTFFVMGGAYSMDKAYRQKYFEVCGQRIWFEEELPTKEEYHRAIANLQQANMTVDYVLTHTAPRTIIPRIINAPPDPHDGELTGFLDWIYHEATFRKWYFGHFHVDEQINDQMIACLNKIHILGE